MTAIRKNAEFGFFFSFAFSFKGKAFSALRYHGGR